MTVTAVKVSASNQRLFRELVSTEYVLVPGNHSGAHGAPGGMVASKMPDRRAERALEEGLEGAAGEKE